MPEFSVTIIDEGCEKETIVNKSPSLIWQPILERIVQLRKSNDVVKLFCEYFTGEYMFGLIEPHIIRLIESLPGVETLQNYAFKYGKLQLLDMPLTINPTGCARSEPKLRTHFRKSRTLTCNANQRSNSNGSAKTSNSNGSSNNSSSHDANASQQTLASLTTQVSYSSYSYDMDD